MRVAVIGSGVSGLVCARLLNPVHEIIVYEADSRIGGHVNTVPVAIDGENHHIDTGFIVYNDQTYPVFSQLLKDLGIPTQSTSMSFSVRCDRSGVEYNGTNFNGVFAQRTNLFRPTFLRMLRDIVRFNRDGLDDVINVQPEETVGSYLKRKGYSHAFAQRYLLPMGAAIWSCPYADFENFPIRFILEFYINHGLLSLSNRPVWRVVEGGSRRYIDSLTEPFRGKILVSNPVHQVRRCSDYVSVSHASGTTDFDEVVFACHSDQALRLLADPDPVEMELLSEFPYSGNSAVLHWDESLLPQSRRAWAAWNYHIPSEHSSRPTVTYNMNILQHLQSDRTFCVTLNEDHLIDSDKILARFNYSHPLFTTRRAAVQRRHSDVIRRRRTSYCGAYWGNGFHEDGVVSAFAVCRSYGIPGWSATTARIDRISLAKTADTQSISDTGAEP